MSAYEERIRRDVLGDIDWRARRPEGLGRSRVRFQLNREYNDLSSFLVYDFLLDLAGLFGRVVYPLEVANGCVAIETLFEKTADKFGRDFRQLMLAERTYHELFSTYDVNRIYIHGFPAMSNFESRFQVSPSGIPAPY